LAIFLEESSSGLARLMIERASPEMGVFVYAKPEIVENFFGTFLYVPIRLDGTGAGNESEYYLWNKEKEEWQRIDSETWLKDVGERIPPELHIWKGIWPDLKHMTAEIGLYRDGDANCCPTGGSALIELAIDHGKFFVKSVTVRKEE
jgi:hypothetical protein